MRQAHLHIEGVPNPDAIKFVLENGILSQDPYEFTAFSQTGYSPLARKLMMFKYVESVLIHKNYITLRKKQGSKMEWEEVLMELRTLIQSHLEKNEPILYMGFDACQHKRGDDELQELVEEVFNKFVRPLTHEDGGDIFVESYQNGELKLSLHGSCKGCPYVHQTIEQGVVPVLRQYVPQVQKVLY